MRKIVKLQAKRLIIWKLGWGERKRFPYLRNWENVEGKRRVEIQKRYGYGEKDDDFCFNNLVL